MHKNLWTTLLVFCAILVLVSCAPRQARHSVDTKADLLILHTNDTHSHIAGIDKDGGACFDDTNCRGGLARIAAAIKDAKAQGANVLALVEHSVNSHTNRKCSLCPLTSTSNGKRLGRRLRRQATD